MSQRDITYGLSIGTEVRDRDGRKIGTYEGIKMNRLVVKIGWWKFAKPYYVPMNEVRSEEGVVRINRSLDFIKKQSGWYKDPSKFSFGG